MDLKQTGKIDTGKKIEIVFAGELPGINNSFVSQIESTEKGSLVVMAPIFEGKVVPMQPGTGVEIYFLEDNDLYRFKARIRERKKEKDVPMLVLKDVGIFEKIQRRQFYRIECFLKLRYRPIGNYTSDNENFKNAAVKDLSGGGAYFSVDDKIKKNQLLECELFLNSDDIIKFTGKVIRMEQGNGKYEIAILFKSINNKDREQIIRFIFLEQRKLRKKGLI